VAVKADSLAREPVRLKKYKVKYHLSTGSESVPKDQAFTSSQLSMILMQQTIFEDQVIFVFYLSEAGLLNRSQC